MTDEKRKMNIFLVATNVVASRPPERRLTGKLTARAKSVDVCNNNKKGLNFNLRYD